MSGIVIPILAHCETFGVHHVRCDSESMVGDKTCWDWNNASTQTRYSHDRPRALEQISAKLDALKALGIYGALPNQQRTSEKYALEQANDMPLFRYKCLIA